MVEFHAGVCPRCSEHILLKQGLVFLVCPLCGENIGARESRESLELIYANPARVTENIAKVLLLERKYGPQLPFQILLVLKKNFPQNEQIAFLALKMSGYNSFALKEYLMNFAGAPKPVSFAAEVLENGLVAKNWELSPLFEQYIKNKTTGNANARWLEKLREINAAVAAAPANTAANTLIYVFYIACGIINVALATAFIVLEISFAISVFVTAALLCIEMFVMYRHARKYGTRLTISNTERALMVAFMCSIVVAVGGVFLGALITI